MVDVPTGLWYAVIAHHRTIKASDLRNPGQYLIGCLPCEGGLYRTWRPGESEYECDIWQKARILGLLPVGSE